MTLSNLLIFAGIYLVAASTPGPGLALVVARTLGRGLHGLPWLVAGFVLGDLVLMTLAVSGLAFVTWTFATGFRVVRYAGALYLAWMAWKIWRTPVQPLDLSAQTGRQRRSNAFLSSLSLTLGNPKPIVFFLSIMPLVVDMQHVDMIVYAELGATVAVLLSSVMTAAAILADRARRVFRSEQALRRINKGTAATIAGVAVAVAAG
jgi:threonine/homoserine/homoserine lactone efflux protein